MPEDVGHGVQWAITKLLLLLRPSPSLLPPSLGGDHLEQGNPGDGTNGAQGQRHRLVVQVEVAKELIQQALVISVLLALLDDNGLGLVAVAPSAAMVSIPGVSNFCVPDF